MSKTKPIPTREKSTDPPAKASSLPREKTPLSRVRSEPVSPGDTGSVGAELRRRSDTLFHSNEQLPESEESDHNTTGHSEVDGRERSESPVESSGVPNIDAWLAWRKSRKDRRNSLPTLSLNSNVGTAV